MAGVIVFIICMVLSVLTYKKVSNRCETKGRGGFSTLTISLVMSFIVFIVSLGIGSGIVSQDKNTDVNAKTSIIDSAKKSSDNVYTCNKFEAITQTRQGTKHNSGYYADAATHITYAITDGELITTLYVPDMTDSTDTAKFNKIAEDGSRKYGNSSSNFFVSVLNDSTIKVIMIDFNANMTLTQICSKG
ncbi:hypothetical protein [Edwardsiella piscicida]|uniref:hypothetical protein n=1 Tax=Edwardsiella piscicida TaxID=1263550 RepID=UPI0010570492|nr:hypothetical protein [Edwardsiella piscicida]UCQ36765.1 hypothetical protein DCF36_10980 [Edwardsiella piscicida]